MPLAAVAFERSGQEEEARFAAVGENAARMFDRTAFDGGVSSITSQNPRYGDHQPASRATDEVLAIQPRGDQLSARTIDRDRSILRPGLFVSFVPESMPGSYPLRPGNGLRPLVDGEPAFRRVCEAIEGARRTVWATVTFMWPDFQMPDGRGSAVDVLNRAAARGLDVRLIFWRPDPETERLAANAFWGSPEHIDQLQASNSAIRIRWDRAQPGFCQHQKSWLIDAGTDEETTFLGGINLNPHSLVAPGHRGEGQNHDVYMELAGPSAVDVHHNFVQRWNEASERSSMGGRWGSGSDIDLPFPTRVPARRGDALVQIQRTIHGGRYRDGRATPEGAPFDIEAGEQSNFHQYCAAIAAARRSIYIEQQHVEVPEIIDRLRDALRRGVEVVAVLPAEGKIAEGLAALGAFETFTLAGLAGLGDDGRRRPVWVHSKLMVVDGEWGTVGSCNLHRHSLFGNGELNAAFWDRKTAQALLSELLREHLDEDITGMDDLAALRSFRAIAAANRTLFEAGRHAWQGLAFRLLP
jgi:cardiolipin synthase A/B